MRWCAALAMAAALWAGDLERVKTEPNLEKRSQAALSNAGKALKEARDAYAKGEFDASKTLIAEVLDSVELAHTSLKETRKNPRRSPKYFKKAEMETGQLLRKLDAFDQEMSVADRPQLQAAKERIQKIHEELLEGIMGQRK